MAKAPQKTMLKKARGQGMTEYIKIVATNAIAAIGILEHDEWSTIPITEP